MKERPILFNGPMVRAILGGSKTQTRRVVKPAGAHHIFQFRGKDEARGADEPTGEWAWCSSAHVVSEHIHCPYGKPGDRLWVRETAKCGYRSEQPPSDTGRIGVDFKAGGSLERKYTLDRRDDYPWFPSRSHNANGLIRWAPAIHMPRWASRITLKVTGVRVERLQAISDADAESEGIDFLRHLPDADETLTPSQLFMCLWDSVATPGADWAANPWVWVVEFKRVSEAA